MPLHDVLAWREAFQQRVVLAVLGDVEREVAIFEDIVEPHFRVEGAGHELAAEAEAEDRLALAVKVTNEIDGREIGVEHFLVADTLGAAE